MALKLNTAPATEPLTLAEVKAHLRIDSTDFADDITTAISIAPGDHVVAAAYSLEGGAVEVSGYSVLVNLISGTNGSDGTVDVKLQESNDGDTWSDVADGAFTQVTEENDNAVQEKAYTGAYTYIRAVATVAVATCDFGVSVIKQAGPSVEDGLLSGLIAAAREDCEKFQNRAFITQTWELWLDAWPSKDYIKLPLPPLQSVTSIKYYDVDDTEYTFYDSENTDYIFIDTKSEPGWVVLNYGEGWPDAMLRPANAVCVTFVAGYGAASAVPRNVKQAMLLLIGNWYENREAVVIGTISSELPLAVDRLLTKDRCF